MSELSIELDRWIDDNTVDGDFICHPDFIYDKLLELESQLKQANERLGIYQQAVNKLDDYFEYSNESIKDRAKVYSIIDKITEQLDQWII